MTGMILQAATSRSIKSQANPLGVSVEPTAPVLAAIDFSEVSEATVIWASRFADRIGAPLAIIHVIYDPADAPGRYKSDNGDPLEPMGEVAQRKLLTFVDKLVNLNGHLSALKTATRHCVAGVPAPTILRQARSLGAQHLVLGNCYRAGMARLLHTSTLSRVTREADLPITVVKANNSGSH